MNVEFLKIELTDIKQHIENLDTDISRNVLGNEEVDAQILKSKEEIKRLEIQIKKNE